MVNDNTTTSNPHPRSVPAVRRRGSRRHGCRVAGAARGDRAAHPGEAPGRRSAADHVSARSSTRRTPPSQPRSSRLRRGHRGRAPRSPRRPTRSRPAAPGAARPRRHPPSPSVRAASPRPTKARRVARRRRAAARGRRIGRVGAGLGRSRQKSDETPAIEPKPARRAPDDVAHLPGARPSGASPARAAAAPGASLRTRAAPSAVARVVAPARKRDPATRPPTPSCACASRAREPELITEPQRVKGSTRLEAKKQRRRDGRDAGRRRPVVTEAEFLARRESVDRVDGRALASTAASRSPCSRTACSSSTTSPARRTRRLIGNVYLGRVQNVLPSMEAAFVDIGRGRNAVLYSGEVDWDAAAESDGKNQARRIELALKPGDRVLVQVTKDPVGHKGARLTSQVSLPGRYLVYVPERLDERHQPQAARHRACAPQEDPQGGAARERRRHRAHRRRGRDRGAADARRAAPHEPVGRDQPRRSRPMQAPALLHSEPDLLIKIVRDVFNEDFHEAASSQGDDAHETIRRYLARRRPRPARPRRALRGRRSTRSTSTASPSRSRRRSTARSGCPRAVRS